MAVIYNASVRTARMQEVADAIGAGSTPGVLQIGTAGMAQVLATIPLDDPPGVAGDVLTLLDEPAEIEATAGGTAAAARIRDSDNVDVVTGLTVGVSASDIIIDNVTITLGQNVRVTAATITHPSA